MEPKTYASFTDDMWIEKASQGDLEAFNQLVLSYQDMAYNHAYSMLGDTAQAEDVTQESFIKAFQALNSFRGGSFRGWLLRIVTNSVYDLVRRSAKRPVQSLFPRDENGEECESASWLADPGVSVEDTVERNELSTDLQHALNELPDVYRSVIILVDVHEFDYGEAAQALNVPVGTVKSRLARARLQMQKKLRDKVNFAGRLASVSRCFAA